uniref:Uncharacterized protein n=1 Tax=Brassica oleracea var. oleracea TaxID=109376 RepID=A0A0D3CFN7_BRAOL
MRDPKEFWKSLKDRFNHQKDITLPLARDEWQSLRFQDFDKVMNYNFVVLGIVTKLRRHTPHSTKATSPYNKNIGCGDIPYFQI